MGSGLRDGAARSVSKKIAKVQFYFDADVLGLARLLCQERADFTFPGDPGAEFKHGNRPACPVDSTAIKDPIWIPIVAKLGWLVVTRDAQIQGNLAEIEAVRDNGCKMLNLSSGDASTKWGQLELFMARWREIELLPDTDGPFIIEATRTGKLAPMDLDAAIAGLKRRRSR